ncbi:MAG: tetratricopeptide repeat protein [Pyrinomonadaceae bacterium]
MAEQKITIEQAQENILACATFTAQNIKSLSGHAAAMKEIVPRYLEKPDVDLAAEFANSVDDPFTRDRLLMLVAEKCAALDDDEYGFQLVEAIEDEGTRAQARERIAVQKSAKGEFAKALEIAETLSHPDYVFGEIAVRQFETNDDAGVLQTIEKIDFPSAKATALQNIALLNLKNGDNSKASGFLKQAVDAANEIEFIEERVRTLINIGNHFIEANQKDKAIETFDLAKNNSETIDGVHRDSFLASIALGFLQAGSLELADRTLDLIADKTQMSATLIGFAREFWNAGECGDALETLEEAYQILKSQRDNEIRDSRQRFNLWGTIAVEFARMEKDERAVETAQEIIDEDSQTFALAQIAQICAMQNQDEIARQAINAIQDDAQRMFALIGVSDQKNKLEKPEEALRFLREAETFAETVPQLASRSAAFNELAKRFYAYGDADKARELLHENLETIFQIRDESSRVVALARLADFYDELKIDLTEVERELLRAIVRKIEW